MSDIHAALTDWLTEARRVAESAIAEGRLPELLEGHEVHESDGGGRYIQDGPAIEFTMRIPPAGELA